MKKPTIKDIAYLAGVNPCVVSHVLHDDSYAAKVRPETRARICRIARDQGYVLNTYARAMVTGKSNTIGFVVESQYWFVDYVQQMLAYILKTVDSYGFSLKLFDADTSPREDVIRRIREQQISGVLLHHYKLSELRPWLEDLRSVDIPCCIVDMKNDTGIGGGVISDDADGVEAAVDYLASLGHRRICHLCNGYADWDYAIERARGYARGMRKIPDGESQECRLSFGELGCNLDCLKRLLGGPPSERPTALVCDSDMIAMEAFQAAYVLDIRIPDELSLVGFGCLAPALYGPVLLTTVRQPFDGIGIEATKLLLEHIVHGTALDGRTIMLPNQLKVGDSTSSPCSDQR